MFIIFFLLSTTAFAQNFTIDLKWTDVGNDTLSGRIPEYDLRWSLDSSSIIHDFFNQNQIELLPPPEVYGGWQHFTVNLPKDTVVYLAIIAVDDNISWHSMSNMLKINTTTPPIIQLMKVGKR